MYHSTSSVCLHLVLHGDLCGERVIGVPFLVEAKAQLVQLVLGLQVASRLPRVRVVGAGSGELLRSKDGLGKEGEAEKVSLGGPEKGPKQSSKDTKR